jgi:exosortase/archaeosortase family protein
MESAHAPPAGLRLTRGALFFWLFLIAAGNGLAGFAVQWTLGHGLARSLADLFGISAVVWVAAFAALAILRSSETAEAPLRADWPVAAVVAAAALVPAGPASAVALTLLSGYAIATSNAGEPLRRAAIIFLSITGTLIWGRLLLALLSKSLLSADTFLVASLFGTEQTGNLIGYAGGGGALTVAPGCSSLQGMSVAFVFWALVNQWFQVRFTKAALGWLGAALAATVAINVVRIGSMVMFPEHIEALHHGIGWHVFAWATLAAVAAICLYGARHAVFARD